MTFAERKAQVKSYLGKRVVIGIYRPIGYVHRKENYFQEQYYDTEVEIL